MTPAVDLCMRTRWAALAVSAVLVSMTLMGCSREDKPREPEKAGQPVDRLQAVTQVARMQAAAVAGDQEAVRKSHAALTHDLQRSIRLPDPARRIAREPARAAAKRVPGVRSVIWTDDQNLLAIVESNDLRSHETIDRICLELEPLGDTLWVTVNLQSAAATKAAELMHLSRNCQLDEGEHALMHRPRRIDATAPELVDRVRTDGETQ